MLWRLPSQKTYLGFRAVYSGWTIHQRRRKMDNSHFFDEELEELFYEKLERQIPEKEMEFLRNVYDEGWDVPQRIIGKLHVGMMN